MANIANTVTPTFIRVSRESYDHGETEAGQQIINEIETRYLVLPSNIDISKYHNLEAKEIEEVIVNTAIDTLSYKMIIGTTGVEKDKMKSFVTTLKSLNKNNSSSVKR